MKRNSFMRGSRPVSWSSCNTPWRGNQHLSNSEMSCKFINGIKPTNGCLLESSCEEEDDETATTRVKAKISLDEGVMRTRYDDGEDSKRPLRRPFKGPSELSCKLARSSSYQALHSALARLYRLDDFTTERLGQGFFSEVYKVRHRVTGEIMVLKMNKLVSNRHNMLREVELMNRLQHTNILAYYGVCIHEGQVHALTEYINSGSLDSVLQDSSLEVTWRERVSLSADIARGMTYLHEQGVCHRDLTSKNILIKDFVCSGRTKREAVVADFGLAAPIPKDKSVRMRQVGSPYWMAPEVIRAEWYDHRADVFSFGIILCEMIARCDADPDILPRTNNFGIHYLAFSKMIQNDCPPYFLQVAFQCCQINPEIRPPFETLTRNLEYLHCRMGGQRATSVHRKHKVCHRRSLSDDCLTLSRSSSDESSCPPNNCLQVGRTPQEVVEKIGAADPFFSFSTATVNPFTQIKLPAPSRLVVQDGARFCHSLPEPLHRRGNHHVNHQCSKHRPQTSVTSHHHGSYSNICPSTKVHDCSINNHSLGAAAMIAPIHFMGGAVKRRGSGESGFFSVGDNIERIGTPEQFYYSDQWLSHSELSNVSQWEDEQRSYVTDSSDDLCSTNIQEEFDSTQHETDIKAIVEFFENGYGSIKPTGPVLRPRGKPSLLNSPRSPASPAQYGPVTPRIHRMLASRRDTYRIKDRPKLYITEGTVRARRDIFEAR